MRATLKDVAKMAGVAPNTASMILNRRPESWASDATKKRVFDAAESLNYRPSRAALGIRLGRFRAIGLVVPDIDNPFYANFAARLDEALKRRDYYLVLENGRGDPAFIREYMHSILDRHIDGVCCFMGDTAAHLDYLEEVKKAGKVALAIGGPGRAPHPFDSVLTDFNAALGEMVDHLLTLGHQHFAFLSALHAGEKAGDRPVLFRSLLQSRGVAAENISLIPCGASLAESCEGFGNYLNSQSARHATAVFCIDDIAAIGAIRAAAMRGLNVPQDISIVGVNDIPVGRFLARNLSTIAQPIEEMTSAAAELLVDRLENKQMDPSPLNRYFASRFIARETTGPAAI